MSSSTLRALSLLVALSFSSGCVRVVDVNRGGLLRTTQGDTNVTDLGKRIAVDGGVARVQVVQERCASVTHEYAQVETQEVKTIDGGKLAGGLAITAGSVLLVALNPGEMFRGEGPATVLPVLGLIFGPIMAVFGLTANDSYTREVTVDTTEIEKTTDCRKAVAEVSGNLPWKLRVGEADRTGTTDRTGRLDLRPHTAELISSDLKNLPRIATFTGFRIQLELGDAPRAGGTLELKQFSDSSLQSWATRYDRELKGPELNRWQNCRLVSASLRDAVACHLRM